jgi:putative resolvase
MSSRHQKEDLKRQAEVLTDYCTRQDWSFQVIQDLGSLMNDQKKGLKTLLKLILEKKISRLVLTHKDRLLRFGAELIFALCEAKQIEVVIINRGSVISFEEELRLDIFEIITLFAAKLYGSRSRKNQKLVEAAKVLISK